MLKIAVCDDEPVFAEQISVRIKKYMPDASIQGFFSSDELLLQGEIFDIYFLDIQMEKMNGVETAKKLRELDEESVIVFITGAKEYVFEAFDVAALHYLIKPVDNEKLQEVLERAKKEIEKKQADMEREAGESFYRCHRGYLVNLSYVAEYDTENIMLTNGEKIYSCLQAVFTFTTDLYPFKKKTRM